MLEISTQTGAHIGMIFDIRIGDFDAERIELRATKKKNDKGYVTKAYTMTPDLLNALNRAIELRKKNRGGAASLPSDSLFFMKQREALRQGGVQEPLAHCAREVGDRGEGDHFSRHASESRIGFRLRRGRPGASAPRRREGHEASLSPQGAYLTPLALSDRRRGKT
ncbi:MAG: hypothetical protein WA159_18815 [Variovorax sp.]